MNTTLTDWNIQDYLKTPEDRAFYIEAAIEEAVSDNDMRFLAEAFGDVARAVGNGKVAVFMSGISTGMKSMPTAAPRRRAQTRLRRERVKA